MIGILYIYIGEKGEMGRAEDRDGQGRRWWLVGHLIAMRGGSIRCA